MRETLVIAKREFLERVRTKWFIVMTILGPIFMVAMIVGPPMLAGTGSKGAKVAIVDPSGKLGAQLASSLTEKQLGWSAEVVPPATTDDQLLARVRTRAINGFLRVPEDALTGGTITYQGDNATNQIVSAVMGSAVTSAVRTQREIEAKLTPDQRELMDRPIHFENTHTTGGGAGTSGTGTFFLGYFVGLLLYMMILLFGVNVMTSVVTEKSSRVVELLVAATKPGAMMGGKILGVGGAALAQIGLWLVVAGFALAYHTALFQALGIHAAANALPEVDAATLVLIGGYFIAGFLFYSTIYAAIGATVSSEQDARQAQTPITLLLAFGMISLMSVTGDPRGSAAAVLTTVPFWSPMLMPMRYVLGGATPGEVALSLAVLVGSTLIVARAAAKIYRVGILMYGKRPGLGELLRWLRY